MPWCRHCKGVFPTDRSDEGFLCCSGCGRVTDMDMFSTEITFFKNAGGQSQLSGNFVKSVESDYSTSHARTLEKGRDEISNLVDSLDISGGNSVIDPASAFYRIAVERNFTRGRRTSLVAAACLYIVCRESKKEFLLIDFSEILQTNVYVLGAVFLQLCKLLRLEEHPIVQKPVDPSLFIHRFTNGLLRDNKDMNSEVSRTALRIIASMKRDWMQTGRKPSGLCGAALYISALSHGLKYSKSDIVSVVHICEATLTRRLIEFENTESGSLTIEEFNTTAEELERESRSRKLPNVGTKPSGERELLCEHKGTDKPHFAHGLCKSCYDDFVTLSGGLQGGSEPPAFQRAQRERVTKAPAEKNAKESSLFEKETEPSSNPKHDVIGNEKVSSRGLESSGAASGDQAGDEGTSGQSRRSEDMDNMTGNESESLSDIDDVEVDGYLHNEEEKRFKKIIWEEMNREYLEVVRVISCLIVIFFTFLGNAQCRFTWICCHQQNIREQAAKEAAAAAAKEAYEAHFQNCSEDLLAAQELAAAAAAAVAKSRKERQQQRAAEAKNAAPAQSAAEAARQMLTKKRLSSKINYDVLDSLFSDTASENTKEKRIESDSSDEASERQHSKKKKEDSDVVDNVDDIGMQGDEYGEEDNAGEKYGDDLYYGNEEEYGYEDYGYEF